MIKYAHDTGWEAKRGLKQRPGRVGRAGAGPDPAGPRPCPRWAASDGGRRGRRGEHGSAPPRAAPEQRPPPPRAGRDLSGQRGAERPDAGGAALARPWRGRFPPGQQPRRLSPGARASLAAGGGGGDAAVGDGAPQGLGAQRGCSQPRRPSRLRRCRSALHPLELLAAAEERHSSLAAGAPPSPFKIFWRGCGRSDGGELGERGSEHARSAHLPPVRPVRSPSVGGLYSGSPIVTLSHRA